MCISWPAGVNEDAERQRLEALYRYRVLDTPAEPVFDDLAAIAAEITGTPTALISLVDADRQWFKAAVRFPFTQSARAISFCSHTIQQPEVLTIEDATADERFADNPLVTDGPQIRFYAGAPLITSDGHALGTVCGIDYEARTLTDAQGRALQRLARQVVRELEVRRDLAELSATVTGHRRSETPEMLRAILDGTPAQIYVKDTLGRYLLVNEHLLERSGFSREQVLGKTDADLFGPGTAAQFRDNDLRVLASVEPLEVQEEVAENGQVRIHSSLKFPLLDWRGSPYATCGISTDITDRIRVETQARHSSERAQRIIAGALDGIVACSADGSITEFNPAAERIYGCSRADVLGGDMAELLIPPSLRSDQRSALAAHLRGESTEVIGNRIESLGQRLDGETFPVEFAVVDIGTDPGRFISFVRDVSDRRHAEQRLRQLAEHDPHTGLANRATFVLALTHHAAPGVTQLERGSLLLIDLDAFKHINDTFGHRAGDDCLRHVAEVLLERVRDGDLVSRLGGDEFAVLLPAATTSAARGVAESLLGLLRRRPLIVDGRPIRLTASIGVAPVAAGVAADELLHTADAAMYEAKQAGRDRVAVYSDVAAAAQASAAHSGHAQRLRDALAESRFLLCAQPIRDLRTGHDEFHELLVRMIDPTGAVIPPAAFLPAAERFDLIQKIDCWVVGEAVKLIHRANGQGLSVPRLHVNLSGRSLSDSSVLRCIEDQVDTVDASRLVFEITETAAVTHLDTAVAFTQRLAAMGCGLSLDDFGAGYASFYYLKHLPVQSVKIDGDFVRGMLTDRLDRAVVRATVSLAEDMGYKTIAEFVENEQLLDELRRYGVDYAQGYHIGRPQDAGTVLGLNS